MRWSFIIEIVGLIVLFVGLAMCIPLGFSLVAEDGTQWAFVQTRALSSLLGTGFELLGRLEIYTVVILVYTGFWRS